MVVGDEQASVTSEVSTECDRAHLTPEDATWPSCSSVCCCCRLMAGCCSAGLDRNNGSPQTEQQWPDYRTDRAMALAVMLVLIGISLIFANCMAIYYECHLATIGHGVWGGAIFILCGLVGVHGAKTMYIHSIACFLVLSIASSCLAPVFVVVAIVGMSHDGLESSGPNSMAYATKMVMHGMLICLGLVGGLLAMCALAVTARVPYVFCPRFSRLRSDNAPHPSLPPNVTEDQLRENPSLQWPGASPVQPPPWSPPAPGAMDTQQPRGREPQQPPIIQGWIQNTENGTPSGIIYLPMMTQPGMLPEGLTAQYLQSQTSDSGLPTLSIPLSALGQNNSPIPLLVPISMRPTLAHAQSQQGEMTALSNVNASGNSAQLQSMNLELEEPPPPYEAEHNSQPEINHSDNGESDTQIQNSESESVDGQEPDTNDEDNNQQQVQVLQDDISQATEEQEKESNA